MLFSGKFWRCLTFFEIIQTYRGIDGGNDLMPEVYNLAQSQVRSALQACADTLPNQLGKPTSAPTLRWIFQLMEGIALVRILDYERALIHEAVSNNDLRIKIVRLFGDTACKSYQIQGGGSGM